MREDPSAAVAPIRFGTFEVDVEGRVLRKRGLNVKLRTQAFEVLAELLQRPGETVTREELQTRLWPSDTFVDFDHGLNKAINRLREALGDSAEEPRFIETVPRRGYRFIGRLETPKRGNDPATPMPAIIRSKQSRPALRWIPRMVAAAALMVVCVVLALYIRHPAPATQWFRSSLLPPPGGAFLPRHFAVSADGARLVFSAFGPDGRSGLWLRAFSVAEAHRLDNTDGGQYPFWSPDGRSIGFFADRKLKTIEIASGVVKTLASAQVPTGGAWSSRGVIVFGAGIAQPLYRIPANGGEVTRATPPPADGTSQTLWWPYFLPDGSRFLYSVRWTMPGEGRGMGLYLASLDSSTSRLVSQEIIGNVALVSGRLLFVRAGRLFAQRVDEQIRLIGKRVPVTEQEIETDAISLRSGFAAGPKALVFESAADFRSHLTWFDASGRELGQIAQTGYRSPNLSPDGQSVAAACDQGLNGKESICIYDLKRGVSVQLTDDGTDSSPIWSRDGKEITYESRSKDIAYIKRVAIDRRGSAQVLRQGGRMGPSGWLPDGRLLFNNVDHGEPRMYLARGGDATFLWPGAEAQLSPDGRWIAQAYAGIFVAPVAEPWRRVQIANTGAQPRWSRNGRQLFYIDPNKKLMAVSFDPQNGNAGAPQMLFQTRIVAATIAGIQYDVSPDGRFLINSLPSRTAPLTLVTGWMEIIQASSPPK